MVKSASETPRCFVVQHLLFLSLQEQFGHSHTILFCTAFMSKRLVYTVDRIYTHLDDKMTNNEAHIHYKIEKFSQIKYNPT